MCLKFLLLMKKFTLFFCTIVSVLSYAQSPTAPALGFNVFVQKNATLTTNETDGPVAIGGQLYLGGNYQVATNSAGNYMVGGVKVSLLVGQGVNFSGNNLLQVNQNGYVKIGNGNNLTTWYRDLNNAASPIRITPANNYNSGSRIQMQANAVNLGVSATVNPVVESGLIDFADAFTTLKLNSTRMSICQHNVNLATPNGVVLGKNNLPSQVHLTLSTGINVFNINSRDINAVRILTFKNAPSASRILLINVDASGVFNWDVWNQAGIGGAQSPYIIYNFYNTTSLNIIGSSTIEGTVFAPFADIEKTQNQSNIEGQIIAQSLIHAGGENHYYPFTQTVTGCAAPTVAGISVNSREQCIYNNNFVFNSNTTGTAPFTYFWDFGDGSTSTQSNPTKTYLSEGTYLVKHKVVGLGGTDSTTLQVVVGEKPIIGFTINDSIQEYTGNNFVFTTLAPNGNYSFVWLYGNGSTPGTTVNTSKSYGAVGPYFVCQIVTTDIGCADTAVAWVVVTSDSVGSGNGGGLESESLGGLVSMRDFTRLRKGQNAPINYALSPVFVSEKNGFGKKTSLLSLADMIPASLLTGDVARVTSPSDLLNITSALEVISVDYTQNNRAKAVVLGIKTKNKAYSHTKSICDRLRGATLLTVDSVKIKGFDFVRFVLQQGDGTIEFGTSFVLGYKNGVSGYTLQTNWLLSEMIAQDSLYNFQVWSTQPEYTDKLVGDIIDIVTNAAVINPINNISIPSLFITKGYRKGAKLVLHVKNKRETTRAELALEAHLNEQSFLTQSSEILMIDKGDDQVFEVVVNDGYEYSINVIADSILGDVAYMADGNWGLDYDKTYTTITNFVTQNEPTRIYNPSDLSVYRYASVSAISDDYVLLFKGINQGNAVTSLIPYSHLTFFAKGNGNVQVTLPRDSITNWKHQYYYTIALTTEGKMYTIPLADFKSDVINTPFNPTDVRMISFARGYQGTSAENMELAVGSVSFNGLKSGTINNQVNNINQPTIFPNPNSGSFTLSLNNGMAEIIELTVTDLLGKTVYTQNVQALKGPNNIEVVLPNNLNLRGLYLISTKSKSGISKSQKFIIN